MEGVSIYVGSMPSFTTQKIKEQNKLCGAGAVVKYEAEKEIVIVRACDYEKGRYVYIVKMRPFLKLCGVEVFGYQGMKLIMLFKGIVSDSNNIFL